MSIYSDDREEIRDAIGDLTFNSKTLKFFTYEPEPFTQTMPFLAVWRTGDPDIDRHGYELRCYVDPNRGLQKAQQELDDLTEIIDAALPGYFTLDSHTTGIIEDAGTGKRVLVTRWPLELIRKERHL